MNQKDIQRKIKKLENSFHCANCGDIAPEIVKFSDDDANGLTQCCNESVCKGDKLYEFGNNQISVRACCWAMAELKFKDRGVDILKMDTIRRFSLGMDDE